jgi:hypothetical protein
MNRTLLDRRTLLRGAGLSLGLPMLEAMTPMARSVFAAPERSSPLRMACVFFPNGAIMKNWKPTTAGDGWSLSKTLAPLESHKAKINVLSGLTLDSGRAKKDGAGDHARAGATFLTAARPVKTAGNVRNGISMDQVAALQLEGKTKLSSIELGLIPSRNAGSCDSGYSCAYSSNIAWRSETQPVTKEVTPRLAFERMFGTGDKADRQRRNLDRRSILDVVRKDADRIMKRVGQKDKRKLEEYFAGIREIERQIEYVENEDQKALPEIDVPYGRVEAFREHARLMYDLMVVAFQTDTTRVATFMLDNAGGGRRYTDVGVKGGHHEISHHRNQESNVADLKKIDLYLVEQFAYFLEKLDAVSETDGTLLDNSMVLYGSGLSDGNRHHHHDLPLVLAGGAGGQIDTDRYVQTKRETPMANLYLSMLDMLGTPAESIGDSSGRLDQLGVTLAAERQTG